MQNTLIYNELWHRICDGDTPQTKPTDATQLAKQELKDEKTLALLHSSVVEHLFIHVKNSTTSWSAWDEFHKLFDTTLASQQVDLHLKLLRQRLSKDEDVLEYISRIKNIHQDIIKDRFSKFEDSFLISTLINGLSSSYKHFIETLQIIEKLYGEKLIQSMNFQLNTVNF